MIEDHTILIGTLIKLLGYKSYLELGVWDGNNLKHIDDLIHNVVGVDIVDNRVVHCGEFYKGTTIEFFQQNTKTFDCIFIDADHRLGAAWNDMCWALKCLNPGGLILIHDTDPKEKWMLQDGYCSDSWRLQDDLYYCAKDGINDWMSITLPIETCGITLIMRNKDRRALNLP